MKKRTGYWLVGGSALLLLVASPLRNLHNLNVCFGDRQGIMDIPPFEMQLEVQLLALQVSVAALAVVALVLGAHDRRSVRLGGGVAWSLVALDGLLWDRWLGNYRGGDLPAHSLYVCLLEARSEHTHHILSNAPLVLSALLALWVQWMSLTATVLGGRPTS